MRAFGAWSGPDAAGDGEVEAVCVDDDAGLAYYADERFGIRQYRADPDHPEADRELATLGTQGFAEDREGIALARAGAGGILVVSDQGAAGCAPSTWRPATGPSAPSP